MTEAEFRKVIQRGMTLDEKRNTLVSEEDVRNIAAQLGVTEESISRALQEIYAERGPVVRSTPQASKGLPLIVALLGMLIGVTLRITGLGFLYIGVDRPEPLLAVLAAQIIAVVVAMSMEGAGRHRKFQIANAALWLGFFVGWVLMNGDVHYRLPGFVAYFAATAAGFGSVAIVVRDTIRRFLHTITAKRHVDSENAERRPLRLRIMRVLQAELWRFRVGSKAFGLTTAKASQSSH